MAVSNANPPVPRCRERVRSRLVCGLRSCQ